jgi:hypothetical protein
MYIEYQQQWSAAGQYINQIIINKANRNTINTIATQLASYCLDADANKSWFRICSL